MKQTVQSKSRYAAADMKQNREGTRQQQLLIDKPVNVLEVSLKIYYKILKTNFKKIK